ncbi:hypothetical protein [Aureivirga sp. CE67]|uniref:hypothetical protein n=1 Tax=Aureivirga sp. CE67 TaxID=1788983 RepID=UPI0018CABD36|nr:hypothetical protein [Aureivirga sp. CE67]
MEVLFHFIFQLFKISIQASIYAYLLILIIVFIGKFKNNQKIQKLKKNKKKYWFVFGFIISQCLLLFSFTYWGNHGLGDGPIIPIGHWKKIENTNWEDVGYLNNIRSSDNHDIHTTRFLVQNGKLCGNLEDWFYKYKNKYFILDLSSSEMLEFKSENDYNKYAMKNNLPKSENLLSFSKNYRNYWGGFRFWLLP